MSLASVDLVVARPSRRPAAKATKGQAAKPQKVSLYLSVETAKRLGVHSTMEGASQSSIVEALIREHLRRWAVQDRRGKSDDQASVTVEGSAVAAA